MNSCSSAERWIAMTHEETNVVEYQKEQQQWDLTESFIQPGQASWQQSKDWTIPKLCQGPAEAGGCEWESQQTLSWSLAADLSQGQVFVITSRSISLCPVLLAEIYQIIISQVPPKALYHPERIPVDQSISSEWKIDYDKCFCNKVVMTCNAVQ